MFYWQDLRYALRLLARQPLFTLLTVAVLAGGLGLSIFTFSFLHTAMLKPLPVPGGERIVRLLARSGPNGAPLEAADIAAMRTQVTTLSDIGVFAARDLVVGTGEGSRVIRATASEWSIFEVTHTRPAIGRSFTPDDQRPGSEPVMILTHWAWRVLFGADSGVIGKTVPINGVSTRVVGVMPDGFGFPVASEAWVPIETEFLRLPVPLDRQVEAYARLAPGATPARAE
ncbi:MAG TPA: ABC transporter permease, partial [Gemmatimonadales bacterium]|nr:ABC transporter permease [Gemmatimonadales bacterium]